MLLKKAVIQIRKAVSSEDGNRNEEAYMNCLLCFNGAHEDHGDLSLVQAVLSSVKGWCDSKLRDYHLYFAQVHDFKKFVLLFVIMCTETSFLLNNDIPIIVILYSLVLVPTTAKHHNKFVRAYLVHFSFYCLAFL